MTNMDPDLGRDPATETPHQRPWWVKVSLVIVAALIALFVVLKLLGVGGDHGPGLHGGLGEPSTVTATDDGGSPA